MIKLHILNVGHGDCILVQFIDSKRDMLIDVNQSSDYEQESKMEIESELLSQVDPNIAFRYKRNLISLSELAQAAGSTMVIEDPIEYLKAQNVEQLFRFVSTHPHMDHLTGLASIHQTFKPRNYWILPNEFTQDSQKLSATQKVDWDIYNTFRNMNYSAETTPTILSPKATSQAPYWKEDGIQILSPTQELISLAREKNNPNIMSYVLLITHGLNKIILGGDAEKDTWDYIVKNHSDLISNITILKASHHGRDSGFHPQAVEIMNPVYTIVSVGKKPETDASNKYKSKSKNVWSTRWYGNISFDLNPNGSGRFYRQYDR